VLPSFVAEMDYSLADLGLGDDPVAMFQEKGNVALGRGPRFGTEGRGFARLTMGTSPELLVETARRMAAAL
jgi:cystathionine beta-lyase